MRDDGELPFIQIRRRYKCKRSDIEKYLQDQRFHPKKKSFNTEEQSHTNAYEGTEWATFLILL